MRTTAYTVDRGTRPPFQSDERAGWPQGPAKCGLAQAVMLDEPWIAARTQLSRQSNGADRATTAGGTGSRTLPPGGAKFRCRLRKAEGGVSSRPDPEVSGQILGSIFSALQNAMRDFSGRSKRLELRLTFLKHRIRGKPVAFYGDPLHGCAHLTAHSGLIQSLCIDSSQSGR
jgi:hypothetical protein